MHAFTLHRPRTLAEAASLMGAAPGARLLAGGTDLVPNLRRDLEQPGDVIDLSRIEGFGTMAFDEHTATLGAGVRLSRLASAPEVLRDLRAVAQAAASVAAPGHRSAATLGGNLCLDTRCVFYNQSAWWRAANAYCLKKGGSTCHVAPQGNRCHAAFSGDVAPALLVFDAEIELAGAQGTRRMPLADFYRDDGAAHLTREHNEIVATIRIPRSDSLPCEAGEGWGGGAQTSGYRKTSVRASIDFPLAGVAVALQLRGHQLAQLRVAITGTNSRPFVLEGTDALLDKPIDDALLATLGKLVQKQVSPMRTTVTAAHHRRLVAAALAQRLVRELVSEATASGRLS